MPRFRGVLLRPDVSTPTGGGGSGGGGGGGSSAFRNWYGVPFQADALGNLTIQSNQLISQRWRCYHTGQITAVNWYLKVDNAGGYSGGTGGRARIRIFEDDGSANNRPNYSAQVGGSATHVVNNTQVPGLLQTLSSPASVTEGQLYHLVWDNTDSAASTNYFSINCLNPNSTDLNSIDPVLNYPLDWGVARQSGGQGGTWANRYDSRGPSCFALRYTDGFVQGNSYMEVWQSTSAQHHNGQITSSQMIRQSFVPDINFSALSFGLRYRRSAGTGSLNCRFETSGGSLIENLSFTSGESPTSYGWREKNFAAARNFVAGQTYRFILTTGSGNTYVLGNVIRDGSHFWGYPSDRFSRVDGLCQYSTDGGANWRGWIAFNSGGNINGSRIDGDIPFYLRFV